ncbi:methyltransferase domain-containing protein [Pseudomonas sp. ZL2]
MDKSETLLAASECERVAGDSFIKHDNLIACEESYNRSLDLYSDNFKTLNNLGVLHEKLGNLEHSTAYYRKACSLVHKTAKGRSTYFTNLGRICEKTCDTTLALWAYEKAIEAQDTAEYSTAVRYLEVIRKSNCAGVDRQSARTLEKVATISNVDLQAVSDAYLDIIACEDYFDSSHPANYLHLLSAFEHYPLFASLLNTQSVANPTIEHGLSLLNKALHELSSHGELTSHQAYIFETLRIQNLLSNGIHVTHDNSPTTRQGSTTTAETSITAPSNPRTTDIEIKTENDKFTYTPRTKPHPKLLHSINRDKLRLFYESNPYPHWKQLPLHTPSTLDDYFSNTGLNPSTQSWTNKRILVAGCGTGRHAIQLALNYPDTEVIGVDVSLPSLRHANKQKNLYSIKNVKFIHCSISDTPSLGIKFKIIECIGVLHHLKQPARTLKVLLSVLAPDGIIKLGLYSKYARATLEILKSKCKEHEIPYTPDNIPSIRNLAITLYPKQLENLIYSKDFYSIQGCMDLLFNPCEIPFTTRKIYNLIRLYNLDFAGFELNNSASKGPSFSKFNTIRDIKSLLNRWHEFEVANPSTFSNMYLFWLRPRMTHENS